MIILNFSALVASLATSESHHMLGEMRGMITVNSALIVLYSARVTRCSSYSNG